VGNAPKRLGNLIDDIASAAPDALIVVASIIPIANDGTNQKVITYNAAIPDVVSARATAGKHVVFLDNYATFSSNPNFKTALMGDSLHPNDAGYAVLGGAFYGAIAASLQPSP
jgi:lysophospholipase L1-like esterase